MSVSDTNTLDGFTAGDRPGEAILFLFDHLPWDDNGEHLKVLQDKLNSYLGFIESKQYQQVAPGKTFHKFVIRISCLNPPNAAGQTFLQTAAKQMQPFNVSIELDH
jgi:hypothetical protein